MGSTLMATTSILLCSSLAAVISSTYNIKKPLNDAVYGAHGEFMVNFLINCPPETSNGIVTHIYMSELLERGFMLNTVGNRLFYAALPLLLWIFGPVLVFLCSITLVPVLYNLDFIFVVDKKKLGCENGHDCVSSSV
ncbi:hypothetical protein BUALT_Bualt10G0088400 [Buddleja alternifolia]|uniref:Uncharacterized protein n=1 Tax=Buddleja alternifolia TaxID=168488 RepID=A0AAV6WYW0_9LAMI|nr:hypothetical protein BUALT_Bualt10G0088400 [Buddleja alternifolia]